jgi:hypothetical protein
LSKQKSPGDCSGAERFDFGSIPESRGGGGSGGNQTSGGTSKAGEAEGPGVRCELDHVG